ncbi:MAG TPA: ferrochelatase [Pirellulales bacterium]|nr:ferrochelatase [Pirellulales bacterium]
MGSSELPPYDSLLVVSFGGPEGPADVIPFLENVLRGRNVPRERLLAVAEHYQTIGGASPINAHNRELIAGLEALLAQRGPKMPVYFGNRNWHPLLSETIAKMASDGRRRALGLVTSAYSSYSGCRQYLENIADARRAVGADAPQIEKLRAFYNHPGFIEATVARMKEAFDRIPLARRSQARIVFTAHSLPMSMASRCRYVAELEETCRLAAASFAPSAWQLAFQSRSGPPAQPWLEPDVGDALEALASHGVRDVVVVPVGFLSDHVEVLYDLDIEARQRAESMGMTMIRARTVGTHPAMVGMIRELILERLDPAQPRRSLGQFGPSVDMCALDCCPRS